MKKIILLLGCLCMLFCFSACDNGNVNMKDETINSGNTITSNNTNNNSNGNVDDDTESNQSGEESLLETNDKYANVEQNPIVTMETESGDIIKIELYPQIAPTTVENFIALIEQGFYNGLTFHRVIPEFMAQGGDPLGNGTGGPGYTIKGEFSSNGFKNDLSHEIGVISMARTNDNNGAGSQFFIVTNELSYTSLDGLYAGFGKVIEGMDAVYTIVNSEVIRREVDDDIYYAAYQASLALSYGETLTAEQESALTTYYAQMAEKDRPVNPPKIKSMTVETFGVDYDEPQKITE